MTDKCKVGYVYDDIMRGHKYPFGDHPECPERIETIYKNLCIKGLIDKMIRINSVEIEDHELELAHNKKYLETIKSIFTIDNITNLNHTLLKMDDSIYGNDKTYQCARIAAGSTLNLIKSMCNKEIDKGVAIVRPPGHHATKNSAMGFCFFNNVSIAAIYARNKGLKVVVVDFDIHSGNGSENILQGQKNIYFMSIHRYDYGKYYPQSLKTGSPKDNILINGDGVSNYCFNSISGDTEYLSLFDNKIIPKINMIDPDIILVSAGFDAGIGDPLGGYNVTPNGFGSMVKKLINVCPNIALILEGGYNLNTISKSMEECVKVLLDS